MLFSHPAIIDIDHRHTPSLRMNKKKRKLRAPIASLGDKQFILNTPFPMQDTPIANRFRANSNSRSTSNSSSSILNRQNLTYTPMTRKLLQKQQQFTSKKAMPKFEPFAIIPSISSSMNRTQHNNNNMNRTYVQNLQNKNTNKNKKSSKRKKKRRYSEINGATTTPIIPGSVRKKRRLSSSSKLVQNKKQASSYYNKNKNRNKNAKLSNSAKKKVMKKLLNNEYNPSLSLSSSIDSNVSNNCNSNCNKVNKGKKSRKKSISKSPSMNILIDYKSVETTPVPKKKKEAKRRKVLDFDTPSKSVTPPNNNTTNTNNTDNKKKKRKRRLSSGLRDLNLVIHDCDENERKKEETKELKKELKEQKKEIKKEVKKEVKKVQQSRRRRKRQSLSSNAIKKICANNNKSSKKKKERKEISPFDNAIPMKKVKKTYKRRNASKKPQQNARKAVKSKKKNNNCVASHVSICPLLTKLMEDRANHPSCIASVSYECFIEMYPKINPAKQSNILRKLDGFLCLLCRAEIMLNNEERTRLQQIQNDNDNDANETQFWINDSWDDIYSNAKRKKKTKGAKKRVKFCCYDLSTVTTPEYGELESIKHLESICRLLVQSGKIGLKLFSVKSKTSWTKKSLKIFIETLRLKLSKLSVNKNNEAAVCEYLIGEFNDAYCGKTLYPFCNRLSDLLSSLIRFYLKTIWNASEFLDKCNNICIPKWYLEIGTHSVFDDAAAAEFIPYHAAEISINLKSYYYLTQHKQIPTEKAMLSFGIVDNPYAFFEEMKQVLSKMKQHQSIYGAATATKNASNFEKYLQTKWKELKICLRNVQQTKSTNLYFYLPLLDFHKFLNQIKD